MHYQKVKGLNHTVTKCAAGMGMHVDRTACIFFSVSRIFIIQKTKLWGHVHRSLAMISHVLQLEGAHQDGVFI